MNSKKAKPFGFWANAEVGPIEDVKSYNRALGILWCVYVALLLRLFRYDENDDNTQVLYIQNDIAIFSSFTAPEEVIKF